MVDFDPASENDLLAFAAAGNAGGGQDLLESVGAVGRMRRVIVRRSGGSRRGGAGSLLLTRRSLSSGFAVMRDAGGHSATTGE
jgi:hypothetical protein